MESEIRDQILQYLLGKGIYAWRDKQAIKKMRRGYFRDATGVSDILGVLPSGRFLAVEVKTPKGKTSVSQVEFLRRVSACNGVAIIATSIEDVQNALSEKL